MMEPAQYVDGTVRYNMVQYGYGTVPDISIWPRVQGSGFRVQGLGFRVQG